jgi:hypothetical protein
VKPQRVTVDLAREEDTDRILELNELEYGPDDILVTHADFAWRHSQNAAGQAIIAVVRDGRNEVVGFVWAVPLRMRVKGGDYPAAIGTNLVIGPEYRNTFVYTRLVRRFQQIFSDNGIPLHFSFVSEKTYQRQRKQTPQTVSTIPLFVKPLNPESLAQGYFTKKWQGFMVDRVGRMMSPFVFRQRSLASRGDITVQVIDDFGPDFDEFWLRVRDKYPAMVIRDRAFLAWRFAAISGRRYHILVARAEDEMLGYAVLRCSTIRGVRTGLVMDLLVSESSLSDTVGACLVAEAEAYFRAEKMALAAGLMTALAGEFRIMSQAGYRSLPPAMAPRVFRFGFIVHDHSEQDLALLSAQDWFITLADYESF